MRGRPDRRILGEVIRSFRELRGWSQEDLGEYAEIHRTYIGSVERGERNPSFESISRILDALDVSWAEFGAALDAGRKRKR